MRTYTAPLCSLAFAAWIEPGREIARCPGIQQCVASAIERCAHVYVRSSQARTRTRGVWAARHAGIMCMDVRAPPPPRNARTASIPFRLQVTDRRTSIRAMARSNLALHTHPDQSIRARPARPARIVDRRMQCTLRRPSRSIDHRAHADRRERIHAGTTGPGSIARRASTRTSTPLRPRGGAGAAPGLSSERALQGSNKPSRTKSCKPTQSQGGARFFLVTRDVPRDLP